MPTAPRTWELLCSRELALRLGAVRWATVEQYRRMRDANYLLLRDPETGTLMFWPRAPEDAPTRASS